MNSLRNKSRLAIPRPVHNRFSGLWLSTDLHSLTQLPTAPVQCGSVSPEQLASSCPWKEQALLQETFGIPRGNIDLQVLMQLAGHCDQGTFSWR